MLLVSVLFAAHWSSTLSCFHLYEPFFPSYVCTCALNKVLVYVSEVYPIVCIMLASIVVYFSVVFNMCWYRLKRMEIKAVQSNKQWMLLVSLMRACFGHSTLYLSMRADLCLINCFLQHWLSFVGTTILKTCSSLEKLLFPFQCMTTEERKGWGGNTVTLDCKDAARGQLKTYRKASIQLSSYLDSSLRAERPPATKELTIWPVFVSLPGAS